MIESESGAAGGDMTKAPRSSRSEVLTVVGARPQFVKASALSRLLRESPKITEVLVHTGQHYDDAMSAAFFRELGIPEPDLNLGVGSGSHGVQTGRMLEGLERVMTERAPGLVLIYGDTNSTLAGALAAAKIHIPVAHVEAGLRSHNWAMPEEINRVIADRLSALLFCPSEHAAENLRCEGITQGVHVTGDIMQEAVLTYRELSASRSDVLSRHGLEEGRYVLATIHRAENTDTRERLDAIISALGRSPLPVLFPAHPRTAKAIAAGRIALPGNIRMVEPLGYLDMVQGESCAKAIVTDSGGVQKEAYWLGVPCVTARAETEWVETVDAGWNRVVGADAQSIAAALSAVCEGRWPTEESRETRPQLYGDGKAGERMRNQIRAFLRDR